MSASRGSMQKKMGTQPGPQYDLTSPAVENQLHRGIEKGQVIAAMLAPPCSTFSPARDRTSVIRNRAYPWGLTHRMLSEADREKLRLGNNCMRAAIRYAKHLHRRKTPWALENPRSSKCWRLPGMQQLESSEGVLAMIVDFCQFGTPWKK